jgi:AcrR family transcriptional regulator
MGRRPRISREQILETARAEFTARGFDGTTLAEVGKRLGVTAAAILRHFPSKQELFTSSVVAADAGVPAFLDDLAATRGTEDPRVVLRRFAEQAVPFVRRIVGAAIAVQMHVASRQTTVALPFAPNDDHSPPRRALRVISDYFRRAAKAGAIRTDNPRALALLFMGQLQSYVLMHEVLKVTPVIPLEDYLDALIDLWVDGGIRARQEAKAPRQIDPRGSAARRRRRDPAVDARPAKAAAARPRRHTRGADGERRLARRRPRDPRSDR